MRQPRFWSNPPARPGLLTRILSPVAALYAGATARRVARKPEIAPDIPVICIGNINIGGTGKTPTAIAICQTLIERGHRPHIVSRGYGGKLDGPVQVDPTRHNASECGDEPLLLAAFAPTWVAKDRAAGARAAQESGATILVLDDGFQNPSVRKDLSIVVVDAVKRFGNERVIPAGPLREPLAAGLARADMVLVIGPAAARDRLRKDKLSGVPCIEGKIEPLPTGMPWTGMRALAFAGIGHPEKFFATLKRLGADLVRAEALSDHQPLTDTLMMRLEKEAKLLNANLVTTEKDAVRLPDTFRTRVITLPVRLVWRDDTTLARALEAFDLRA